MCWNNRLASHPSPTDASLRLRPCFPCRCLPNTHDLSKEAGRYAGHLLHRVDCVARRRRGGIESVRTVVVVSVCATLAWGGGGDARQTLAGCVLQASPLGSLGGYQIRRSVCRVRDWPPG